MIEELSIRDLGVIGEARLPLGPGFTAITGETGDPIAVGRTGTGLLFPPGRVAGLSAALEANGGDKLRAEFDLARLDAALVLPDDWLAAGDDLLEREWLPSLATLQSFYRAAARAGEAVLVICL